MSEMNGTDEMEGTDGIDGVTDGQVGAGELGRFDGKTGSFWRRFLNAV